MKDKEIALETRQALEARLFSPSAARNREFIRDSFIAQMPLEGTIVEVGSGTGEHVAHLAAVTPDLFWRPGDPDETSRASIAAWTAHLRLTNVAPPHAIDVMQEGWEMALERADGVVSINMIHIAPFEAAMGLVIGAAKLLKPGGKLFLYGPFSRNGAHTAPSNAEFDASLKARHSSWGVRDLELDIIPLAEAAGLKLAAVIPMPANNLSVVFEQSR